MQITISMPVDEAEWLRSYAANARKHPEDVVAAAISRARLSPEPPRYVEPGTSTTRRGVVEVRLTLSGADAQWLLQRAAREGVSACAVLGAVLRCYQPVAPCHDGDVPFTTVSHSQVFYYSHIDKVCRAVARGEMSPDEADEKLAWATTNRVHHLLPTVEADVFRAAVKTAMRELCINHPGIRRAHGREE